MATCLLPVIERIFDRLLTQPKLHACRAWQIKTRDIAEMLEVHHTVDLTQILHSPSTFHYRTVSFGILLGRSLSCLQCAFSTINIFGPLSSPPIRSN
uniref:Uncharacterized protein n=1 Tax=Parascaris univalens TaxID=6257 RepID=A0A915A0T7_PARUN